MPALQAVLRILDLEPLEVNLFRGRSPQSGWQRVFGGQVIGQALVAACRTVDGRQPHSMHAYFLLPGDPKVPIIYEVDRIRDGKSFTTRRVVAIQHGAAIFSSSVSFHNGEAWIEHQARMPDVPPPEALPSESQVGGEVLEHMPEAVRRYYERERPIELRPVEYARYFGKKFPDAKFHVWIRTTGRLPDDPAIHQCVLAYASDLTLLDTALMPYDVPCSNRGSWRRASTMHSGFIGSSGPTTGCCSHRTVPIWPARGAWRGGRSSLATARWSLPSRRRA